MRVFPARWLVCALLMAANAQATPQFVDARDYPNPATGRERFLAAERLLVRGFDDICGDTFCEGQYYNLRAMRLRCSVQRATGVVARCVWTFAGSYTWVQKTGQIDVDQGRYACMLPLAAGTRLDELLAAWERAGHEALNATLPGTSTHVYEGLTDCL
ncbi:hypothetical protein D7Y57_09900 [Stenotrophomonas maltophilia]|uniref:Secreted protein n=1 Tax=Stenotrophomonas maltophilia TaxID=40324 RepID=A0AA40Y7N0_STEMA|nr:MULTISPECIES: hypothetical protein [Stenotrophomonas]AWB79798.1 hypothetical protein B7H26_18525 [Stenotrophomonas maltophilia]KDE92092.1 hypothetical protein DF40_009945 [Stenotrophomonas maltophilia M30]KOO86278.1 hypothetical protein VL21_08240 [Stenotrophomonas maltophilia]MBA0456442.1 hypothetical protein [Stenotrophomonas maltophilia]MBH1393098.1 hypothetical protein [Stenotrophomonas maltophilia]